MRRTSLPVVALLAALPVAAASAQRRPAEPDVLPAVIVLFALDAFNPMGEPGPQFTAGRPPAGWPAALVPATTVVGGSTYGPARTLVVRYPRRVDGMAEYAAQLRRAGYLPFDTAKVRAAEGFASRTETARRTGMLYCADSSRAVIVSPIDSTPATRRYGVVLLESHGGAISTCGGEPRRFGTGMSRDVTLRVPPLAAPLGATITPQGASSGGGSNGGSFDVRVEADTALSPAELVAHYGRELVRGGWTLTEPATTNRRQALQPLSARDRSGAEWRGALVINTIAGKNRMNLVMEQVEVR